jgi:hypothetical protein
MPSLIALLRAEAYVVHSYAATAVERFLALKEPGGAPRISAADIGPFAQPLLEVLFAAFKHPERCGAGPCRDSGGAWSRRRLPAWPAPLRQCSCIHLARRPVPSQPQPKPPSPALNPTNTPPNPATPTPTPTPHPVARTSTGCARSPPPLTHSLPHTLPPLILTPTATPAPPQWRERVPDARRHATHRPPRPQHLPRRAHLPAGAARACVWVCEPLWRGPPDLSPPPQACRPPPVPPRPLTPPAPAPAPAP